MTHCFSQSCDTIGTLNLTVVLEGRELQSEATIVGRDNSLVSESLTVNFGTIYLIF